MPISKTSLPILLIMMIVVPVTAYSQCEPDSVEVWSEAYQVDEKLGQAWRFWQQNDVCQKIMDEGLEVYEKSRYTGKFWSEILKMMLITRTSDYLADQQYCFCVEGNCQNGRGAQVKAIKQIPYFFVGDFVNGKYHGKGALYVGIDGKLSPMYVGEYQNGTVHGRGILWETNVHTSEVVFATISTAHQAGEIHCGSFVNGLRSGQGATMVRSKIRFVGSWENDQRHGKGLEYDEHERVIYDGNWAYGKRSGMGKSYYADGKLAYEGTWWNNLQDGRGTGYFTTGQVQYEGEWKNGREEGNGTYYYANGGMRFRGTTNASHTHGKGIYHDANGDEFVGIWTYNNLSHGRYLRNCTIEGKLTPWGNRTRRISLHDLSPLYDRLDRSLLQTEWMLVSDAWGGSRFPGTRLTAFPGGYGMVNGGAKVSLYGARIGGWGRVKPFVAFQSRSSRLDGEPESQFYLDTSFAASGVPGSTPIQLVKKVNNSDNTVQPVIIVSKQLWTGITFSWAASRNWYEIAFALSPIQSSQLRISDNPFSENDLVLRHDRLRNVIDYHGFDYYLELATMYQLTRVALRLTYRAPAVSNRNFPIYHVANGAFERYSIGSMRSRLMLGLNFSLTLPGLYLHRGGSKSRAAAPFPEARRDGFPRYGSIDLW